MTRTPLLTLGFLAALSAPAFADWYIIHGPDRHCRVVERIDPGERDIVRIGPLSFGTREDAEREVRVICRDGYYREGTLRRERYRERYVDPDE